MAEKRLLLVVGMHRSGTTMLANLLHNNGINMGPLRDANFESRLYAWDLHNYLNFLGATWDNPWSLVRDEQSENFQRCRRRFLGQIRQRISLHRRLRPFGSIGFKHPVASLLLPELSTIEGTHIIAITRNSEDVIKSLQRRLTSDAVSRFPGRFSGGQLVYREDIARKLNDHYVAEIFANKDLIAGTLNYENFLHEEKRPSELAKLSELASRPIRYERGFFDGKS